jgi:trimethylamine--corrinoid protein Co-methyltransferase
MTTARPGGRRARGLDRAAAASRQGEPAWRHWTNPYRPIEILDAEQVEAIHRASMKILSETGLRVLSEEAREIYARAGAIVCEDAILRFDPEQILELIAAAPSEVSLAARNPDRSVVAGGRNLAVCTTGGAPNISDLDGGRRAGTLAAFEDLCRLAQSFDVIHMVGPLVEAQDVDPRFRHLQTTRSVVTLTDKVPFVYFRGSQAVADAFEIIRLSHGLTAAEFRDTPVCYSVANSNSPLQLDHLMCRGIIDAAKAGQMMILTPFTLAGAMAPVTLAGALALQNAEALAGLALAQIVHPGAPVCYGSFTSNVDMRSGSPARRTPRPPTKRRCRSGARSWAAATSCCTARAGSKAASPPRRRSSSSTSKCCR